MASTKETQQFCVRWNSYQSNLQSAFPKLLTNEHFVDVTLACESRMVKCHKVVLSACSAYFEKLLVQNPCQHPIIFMKDMKYWEVQALVDFMYKGEVNVTQEELASLLKAAEALEVRGLCAQNEVGSKVAFPRNSDASSSDKKRRTDASGSEASSSKETSGTSGTGSTPADFPAGTTGSQLSLSHSQSGAGGSGSSTVGAAGNNSCNTNSGGGGNGGGNSGVTGNGGTPDQQQIQTKLESASVTPTSSVSNIKQECSMASDNGLFEDLDDDFYQDDNSLQIDETGSAYSLAGPSVQLDCSPEGNHWNLNNGYPNVILTETCSSNFSTPSPSNEQPGKIQRIRRSDAELLSAADSICKGMTFQKASQTFNIPMSTIRFYMARKGMLPSRRRGRRISQGMEQNMQSHGAPSQSQQSSQPQSQSHAPSHQPSPSPSGLGFPQIPSMQMQNPYFKPEPSGY